MLKDFAIVITGCALLALPMPAQSLDVPGVTVDLGGATVMHRSIVPYPQNLLDQRIQGTVNVQVTLDARGNVTDAQVLSGPVELRRTVLESVLQWHFARGGGSTRQIAITFTVPADGGIGVVSVSPSASAQVSVAPMGGVLGGIISSTPARQPGSSAMLPAANEPRRLARIQVSGFNEQLKGELLATLPVREGDMITGESLSAISAAARKYDEHLAVSLGWGSNGEATLQVTAPGLLRITSVSAADPPANWPGVRVAGSVQAAKVVRKVQPVYPPLAKQARIQDHVVLNAQIGTDGTVQNLAVVSGHPLLRQAAIDAVRQWQFEPTSLNGQPVQVVTQIEINFTLQE